MANPLTVVLETNGAPSPATITDISTVQNAIITLPLNTFVYPGFTFTGWNTLANGSGTPFADGASLNVGSASFALYAQWQPNPLQVIFNANGGTGTMVPINATVGATVVLTPNTFVYTGFNFVGWNTQPGGTGTNYANGTAVQLSTFDINLYAQWSVAPVVAPPTPIPYDGITGNRLSINAEDFGEIMSIVGFPLLSPDTDFPASSENIVDYCIFPAVRQYVRYRPLVLKTYNPIGQSFSIPPPTTDQFGNPIEVYGVVDCRISVYLTSATLTGNPFADFRLFDGQIMNRFNKSGLPYEKHTSFLQEIENRTWINLRKTGKFTYDPATQILSGHTSMTGDLEVHWAVKPYTFDIIPFSGKDEAIRLSQANVLRYVAMIDSQQVNNSGVSFDTSHFLDRADKLEEAVLTRLKNRTKVVVIK